MRKVLLPLLALALLATLAPSRAAVVERLRFDNGGVASVEVIYPNSPNQTCESKIKKPWRARYRGALEVVMTDDNRLAIVDEITFPEYLYGLGEVPRSWPEETLRAQVIAARSYALYQLRNPRPGAQSIGYDICSTDRCQVYRGVAVEQGAFGERWVKAVDDTEGMVLTHGGDPVQAFYFSTSSGTTRGNNEVFGGPPRPYFNPVPGKDDGSPMARWTVRIPLAELGPILRRDGLWGSEPITSVRRDGARMVISGGGKTQRPTATSFRSTLNSEASCAFPGKYPPRRSDGSKLPQTVPSIRFEVSVSGSDAVITGRGWGHDVGMSQYGAKALAEEGKSAADILAYYYGGLRPQKITEPGAIRVMVAEGAIKIRITPEGGGTLRTGAGGVIGQGETYEITPGAGGVKVARVKAGTVEPTLSVEAAGEGTLNEDETFTLPVKLSAPARITAVVLRGETEVRREPESSFERGEHEITVAMTGADGKPLADGTYDVAVEAFDGIDRVRFVTPVAISRPPAPRSSSPIRSLSPLPLIAAAALILLLVGGFFLIRTRSRRT
ncbi:MAG TPA: SpoIID/LytB domain-containing protein [Actinomycetota bacterium]|nr:SpoIID/LytB domain-containing protein [Actinomycetota bacterium]